MKTSLTAFLVVLAQASANPVVQENLFHGNEVVELKWCCQEIECWSACTVLCEQEGDASFCLSGSRHPSNRANFAPLTEEIDVKEAVEEWVNAMGEEMPDWIDDIDGLKIEITHQDAIAPEESGGGFFDRRRRLAPITGCPSRPQSKPSASSPEWIAWLTCFREFFLGNEFSRAHCVRVLPQLEGQCLFEGLLAVGGEAGGEPHFKTWTDGWYDYHGECDMTLLHAPSYANGLGLDIHIRTRIRNSYSYIESAAVKIGSDILEIGGFGQYIYNGVAGGTLQGATMGGFELTHVPESKKVHHFEIGSGFQVVRFKTVKDFVSVSIGDEPQPDDYADSEGMLGKFGNGTLFGRDGTTVFTMDNINEFGQEWQVRPDEPKLFENQDREPQFPAQCLLPAVSTQQQRRLGGHGVSEEQAKEACSGWDKSHQSKCVYDVLATGDLEYAEAGGY